eukprot:43621_1
MVWTEEQSLALEVVSIIFSCISFLCDALIILSWYKFQELRRLAYSFVFYIAIANILREFAKMWGGGLKTGTFGCSLQAFLIDYGAVVSFWWIGTIALVMYSMIFVNKFWDVTSQQIERRKYKFIAVNFSIPFIFALIPLFTSSYGNVGGWCWIMKTNTTDNVLRYISYYAHLLIILLLCIGIYIRIWLFLKKNLKANENDEAADAHRQMHKMYVRIKWYPLCLILGFGFAAFRRILQTITNDPLPYSFAIIQAITTGAFGLFILFFYGRIGKLKKLYTGKDDLENMEQAVDSTTNVKTVDTNTVDVVENNEQNVEKTIENNVEQ